MHQAHRLLLKWARTVHVYLTMFGFVLLLFFAVSGFMLNHEDWFLFPDADGNREHVTIVEGKMPTDLLATDDASNELPIVERLRKEFAAHGEVSSFEKETESVQVVFKSPGYLATAVIQRSDGETKVTHQTRGLVGIVLDLHRGKDTGWMWSLVIDAIAIVFVIVGITGLVLWSSLRSRAKSGGWLLLLGLAIGFGIYWYFVPR